MQSSLRKQLKEHLDVRRGQSSQPLEACMRSQAWAIMRRMTVAEKRSALLPGWLNEEAKEWLSWPARKILDPAAGWWMEERPPKPLHVPEERCAAHGQVPTARRGFDHMCMVNREEIYSEARAMQMTDKWKYTPLPILVKKRASLWWRRCSNHMKEAYKTHAWRLSQKKKRGDDGPDENEAAADVPDDRPDDMQTPKKKKGKQRMRQWISLRLLLQFSMMRRPSRRSGRSSARQSPERQWRRIS